MSTLVKHDQVNEANDWRQDTPGQQGWAHSARPGARNKYFMVSTDSHANEPTDLWEKRIEAKFRDRLPRIVTDENGVQWRVGEGIGSERLGAPGAMDSEDIERDQAGADPAGRAADMARDGVDAEIIFPNKGMGMWATPDTAFAGAQCQVWNDWAHETFAGWDNQIPVACIATGDLDGAMAEIRRCADLGFTILTLPSQPLPGGSIDHLAYNMPHFDPMWSLIQDTDMTITFHILNSKDVRASKGHGDVVINYISQALTPTIEPVVALCASGVLERFPKLRFGAFEAGIGWVPWLLDTMDETYRKHHMWARPKLQGLPSDYFRANGFATFQEDAAGLALAERYDLIDNIMWANDYPHHEGTWPHSAAAIERTMGDLTNEQRAKVLGLNAARTFKLDVPAHQQIA